VTSTSWERIPEQFLLTGWTEQDGPLDTPCWIWNGSKNHGGYGLVSHFRAHRISYEIVNGGIPDELLIRHMCHVRACVNPAHLRTGTHAENYEDSRIAGRISWGAKAPNARLTDAQVHEIRALRDAGALQKDLAKQFAVSASCISMILRGARWNPNGPSRAKDKTK
jgi:hypothetical protein